MKKLILSLLFVAIAAAGINAQEAANKIYDENINQMEQIDQALATASSQGKYVICQVGGNWCPWCIKFHKFITDDSEIASFVDQNFVFIHTNYPRRGGNSDPAKAEVLQQTLKRLGNPQRFGFPVFVVLDASGNVLHIQDSSFLEQGDGYDKDKVMRFFSNWTPKAVAGIKE